MNSYFTLRKLTTPTERDLGTTFQRMSELFKKTGEQARLQFQILSDEGQKFWSVEITAKGSKVHAGSVDNPDFEIITSPETWWQIAEGALSPLRAFTQGKMRVRGDIELGKRLLQKLASSESNPDERREE